MKLIISALFLQLINFSSQCHPGSVCTRPTTTSPVEPAITTTAAPVPKTKCDPDEFVGQAEPPSAIGATYQEGADGMIMVTCNAQSAGKQFILSFDNQISSPPNTTPLSVPVTCKAHDGTFDYFVEGAGNEYLIKRVYCYEL